MAALSKGAALATGDVMRMAAERPERAGSGGADTTGRGETVGRGGRVNDEVGCGCAEPVFCGKVNTRDEPLDNRRAGTPPPASGTAFALVAPAAAIVEAIAIAAVAG